MQALSLNSFLLYLLRLSMMFPDSGKEAFSGSFSPGLVDLSLSCGLLTLKLSISQMIVVTSYTCLELVHMLCTCPVHGKTSKVYVEGMLELTYTHDCV